MKNVGKFIEIVGKFIKIFAAYLPNRPKI